MNLNSNIFNSNQKLFNIDLNVITWSNVKPIPQNLNSIVPTFTSSTLTNLPPITSIITSNKKIENYDNLLNEEWDRNGTNIFNLTSNTLNIGGNIKCTDLLINNINIKNISSNLGITNLNIQTNGLINSMLNDSNSYYIIFTSNGFLNIPQDLNCDIILVGAGGNGGNAQSDNSYYNDGFLYELPPIGNTFSRNNGSLYTTNMNINNTSNINSGYKTEIFINNFSIGSGIYEIYYSSLDGASVGGNFWNSFTKTLTPGASAISIYDGSSGMYTGARFLEFDAKGEYLFIKSLLPFIIKRINIFSNLSTLHAIGVGILYGSNDGVNWTIIIELDSSKGDFNNKFINNSLSFIYFAFLFKKAISSTTSTYISIQEIFLFGNFLQNNNIYNNISGGGGSGEITYIPNYKLTSGTYNIQVGGKLINSLLPNFVSANNAIIAPVITDNTSNYCMFLGNGSITFTTPVICDIFMIGGGGGGGFNHGGGGGAGAYYRGTQTLTAGTYNITVGEGGKGGISSTNGASNGGNTTISINGSNILIVNGGGSGGGENGNGNNQLIRLGGNGGCGGGAGSWNGNTGTVATISGGSAINTGTNGTGFGGGTGIENFNGGSLSGGGGGGIGGAGTNGTGTQGGTGGSGLLINITGENLPFGAGGGGGTWIDVGDISGITGSIGAYIIAGNTKTASGTFSGDGVSGTGSGGGGGTNGYGKGGNGGSGIVIMRYRIDTNTSNLNNIITLNNSNALLNTNKLSSITRSNLDLFAAKGGGDGELLLYLNKDTPNLKLNQDATIIFNNESNINLNPSYYNANFLLKTGNIDFVNVSNVSKSYPILKDTSGNDLNPILWYKFDNPLNIGQETYDPLSNSLFIYSYNSNYNIYTTESCKGLYSYQGHGGGTSQENFSIQSHYLSRTTNVNINSVSFSISLWVFFERGYNYYDEPLFSWGSVRSVYQNMYAGYNTSRQIYIDNYQSRILSSSYYEDAFVWTHIVYTFDTTTRAIRIYRNGLEVGYGIFNGQFNGTTELSIGSWWYNEYKLKGKIDDFRVYRDLVLTPIQVNELFEGRVEIFPNSITTGIVAPVAWYKFDLNNLTTDSSGNSYTLTNVGTVTSSSTEQSCAQFNGANLFQINQPSVFSPDNFSIAIWVKLIYNNTYKGIASCRAGSPSTGGWIIYVNGTNLEIWTGNSTAWDGGDVTYYNFVDSSHTTTATALWKHLVVTFKTIATNQVTMNCYINGLFVKSRNYTYYKNTTTNLRIGGASNEYTIGQAGIDFWYLPSGTLIGDFKFYNIELNQKQVTQLYNNSTNVYSNCDLLMDSSNLYSLSSNSLAIFNYSNNLIIPPNNYYVKFFRGSIGLNYPTIRNYPIIQNLTPILWYKFENSNNFLTDSISNNNLWNSNVLYRDINTIIQPDLWYRFDDSTNLGLNSGSLSGYNLTNNGLVAYDTTYVIKGTGCAFFDATLGDYLQLPSGQANVSLFQNLNFSVCFWHYPTDNSQGLNNIFSYGVGGSFHIFYRCQTLPPQIQFDNGSDGIYVYATNNNEFLNKWTFWCYTFNTVTRQQIVYMNGLFKQTRIANGQVSSIADTYFNIGRYGTTTSGNAKSYYLDDFRFYRNRILTPDDVRTLYLNGHTDKSYPSIRENYFSVKGQGSLYFAPNSTNYALIPNNINFNNFIINNGLSISFWFCMNSLTQSNGQIIHFGTNTTTDLSGTPSRYISIRRNALTSQLICEIGGGFENQTTAYVFTATITITMDEWAHLCWTIPNKGYWRIYINSSLVYNDRPFTATSFQGNPIIQEITNFQFNKNFMGRNISGNYFVGNITDFRLYNRIILIDEVFELFNGNAIIFKKKTVEDNTLNNGGIAGYSYITNSNKTTMFSDSTSRVYMSGSEGSTSYSMINTSNQFANYYSLFENNPPWGVYFADDWSGTTLLDVSGNNRHATTSGTITKTTASGYGASAPITYISGGTSASITWPSGSIPINFTLLCLAKYNGTNRQRILQASSINFCHGFLNQNLGSGYRGVVFYGSYLTSGTLQVGTIDDWLCCIGKNGGTNPNNVLLDGVGYGTGTGGTGNSTLTLNTGWASGQFSDWALSTVMIWNRNLSDSEMFRLNNLINDYKSGVFNPRSIFTNNINYNLWKYPLPLNFTNKFIFDNTNNGNNTNDIIIYNNTTRRTITDFNSNIAFNDGEINMTSIESSKFATYNSIFKNNPPWGVYFADDWSGTTLLDISGNNRHATTAGTITKTTASGNGASAPITYISGGTSATITWPSGSIPTNFTLLSLTRYTNSSANQQRILQASTINFAHGHLNVTAVSSSDLNGIKGICYYGDGYKTNTTNNLGNKLDWLSCIGKNSGSIPNNILFDGIPSGIFTNGTGNNILTLNTGWASGSGNSQLSDWALSVVMIWDRNLTDSEMISLNSLINDYKNGILNPKIFFSAYNYGYPILKNPDGSVFNPIAWYKFDSSDLGKDEIGKYNMINNNGVSYEINDYRRGTGSALFDGVNDYLSQSTFDFSNMSFTFSFWVKPTDITGKRPIFCNTDNASAVSDRDRVFAIVYEFSLNQIRIDFNWNYALTLSVTSSELNNWNYYTFIYDDSLKTAYIYKNGILQVSGTRNEINLLPYANWNIGSVYVNSTRWYFKGFIDDFRIYNKVLTPEQVYELYSGRYTDKSYPILSGLNPRAWYKFDNSVNLGIDTMNNYNITNTSALIDYSKSAKSLSSVNFNSAGYFVTSTSLFNNITSYSISLWFYMNALGTYILTSKQHDGNNTYCVISIGCYSNTGGIFASGTAGKLYYHGKNNVTEAVSTSTLLINRWYFFTIVASNTKCQIYINGLLDSSTNGDYSLPNATAVTNSHIGYWFAGGARQGSFINGNMDDFRFYETELTINQIQELYKGRLEIITPINNDSQFIENLTGSNLVLGKKGVGANYYNYFSNLTPSYGSGGHGAGYFGGSGLVIIKIPNYTWSNVNFNWKQIKNINTASPLIADKTNLINLNYNSNIFYIDNSNNFNFSNIFSNITLTNNNNILDINSNTSNLLAPYLNYSSGFNYILRKFPSTGYHSSSTLEIQNSQILNGRECYYQIFQVTTNTYDKGLYQIYCSSSIVDNNLNTLKTVFDADFNDGNDGIFGYNQYDGTTGFYISKWNNYIKEDYKGDWVILKLPYAIILKKYIIYARINVLYRAASEWKLYGSNDGNNFEELDDVKIKQDDYINHKYEKNINNNKYYNYYGFTFGRILLSPITGDTILQLSEIELYDYYYSDTNINIINNQNEYLIGYNNNSNIIRKFPSVPYTLSTSPVSTTAILGGRSCLTQTFTITNYRGNTYDIGTYTVYMSTTYSADANSQRLLFNGNTTNADPHFANDQYRSTDNYYRYDLNNYINPDYKGDWVILRFPYPIIVREYVIYARPGLVYRAPGEFKVYASVDGNTFVELDTVSITQQQYANNKYKGYLPNSTTFYQFYGITVNRKAVPQGDEILNFSQIEFYDYYNYNNYVGIGVNNPQSLVHLADNNNNRTIAINIDGVVTLSKSTNHNTIINNNQNKDIIIGTSNVERLRIKNSSNIGIGTSNPTSKFEINNFITRNDLNINRTVIQASTNASSYGIAFINLNINNYNLFLDNSIITYTADQVNGDNFTINRTGIYSIHINLGTSILNIVFWIDKNQLATTSETGVNGTDLLAITSRGTAYYEHTLLYMGLLEKNDVIRVKANPKFSYSSGVQSRITIEFIMAFN